MKKLPTLHILNGDATVPAFKVADLPGQTLVWREILASGPAVYTTTEDTFWQMRQRYITETYQVSTENYRKDLDELLKLNDASHFFEVVLWFDTDLVCQVNLLYLLHRLSQQKPMVVSVCTSGKGCISYKKHEELQHLFEHRQVLDQSQLEQASELWKLYAGPDPVALQRYLQQQKIFSEYMRTALLLHLQRFPACNSGLGHHQDLLLKTLEEGATTTHEVQQSFWQSDPGYGFGDWQLQAYLRELSPELVAISEDKITLTTQGKAVLAGNGRFKKVLPYWLGGVKLDQQNLTWCRDQNTGSINFCAAEASTE